MVGKDGGVRLEGGDHGLGRLAVEALRCRLAPPLDPIAVHQPDGDGAIDILGPARNDEGMAGL